MKVTNYELSKKLSEIGFKADFDYVISKFGEEIRIREAEYSNDCEEGEYPAYDLETLLEALPEEIIYKYREGSLEIFKESIRYMCYEYDEERSIFIFEKEENNYLADLAAKMIILLHEKALIKFGGENE